MFSFHINSEFIDPMRNKFQLLSNVLVRAHGKALLSQNIKTESVKFVSLHLKNVFRILESLLKL